jgi:hypothetical protein
LGSRRSRNGAYSQPLEAIAMGFPTPVTKREEQIGFSIILVTVILNLAICLVLLRVF